MTDKPKPIVHIRRPRRNQTFCDQELYAWDERVDVNRWLKANCKTCMQNYTNAIEKDKT